jgi:geranylgeranyl pyrophosphate synthase
MFKEKKEENYINDLKSEIDKVVSKYLPKKINDSWLEFVFGKPEYKFSKKAAQKVLLDPIWDLLSRGGKRWRAVFFLLLVEALGGDRKKIRDFLLIPELCHQGSLCIDDIEDNGELRRGKPCLHLIYGIDVALNAGNFLYFFPLLTLIKKEKEFEKEVMLKAFEVCIQEMINIHLGQGTDIFWHKGQAHYIDEREYFQMCILKTGCIPRLLGKLAAILCRKDKKTQEIIGRAMAKIGVAFQIQDDILDITLQGKEREDFGKSYGNDIKEGKRTLMVIYTLKKANKKDKKRLLEILNKHTQDKKEIKEAILIIQKYRAIDYAKKKARDIVNEAWSDLNEVLPDSRTKNLLKEMVYFLIERKI